MNSKFDSTVDGFLDRILGPFQSQIFFVNIIVGILLIILSLRLLRNNSSEKRRLLGWVILAAGCLGIISGTVQLM
ncbi:hypothetical protein D3C81_1441450 [compost metagenome]